MLQYSCSGFFWLCCCCCTMWSVVQIFGLPTPVKTLSYWEVELIFWITKSKLGIQHWTVFPSRTQATLKWMFVSVNCLCSSLSLILQSSQGPGTAFLVPLFLLPSVVELCGFGLITEKVWAGVLGTKPNSMQICFGNLALFFLFRLGIDQPNDCRCWIAVFVLEKLSTLKWNILQVDDILARHPDPSEIQTFLS